MTDSTLTLTVDSIRDYQVCELYYDYKYLKDEKTPIYGRELLAQRFENTLRKVAAFFFYKRQAGVTPSYNALLNRWEKLWFPKDMDAYDLAIEQHESVHGNYSSYSNVATAALLQFYEDFIDDPGVPLLIDEYYLVTLDQGVRLEGRFDLVLRHRDAHKIIVWSARQKRPSLGHYALDFAAQRLAFEYRNETKRNAEYYLYDLASTRPGLINIDVPEVDLDALVYWAKTIQSSETYVPRRGFTSYCRGCPFDKPCSRWNEWPK
ncbi:MAG TPA: hypothetical protein VJ742_12015 [Nitrososphaera sp.]|nr:hypothetical protein [Nitrososphaera sp.]